MRIRWWQSLRWRMVLGSMLLSFMATSLLALTAILVINYYYGVEQQNSLHAIATDKALRIGEYYVQDTSTATDTLGSAAKKVLVSPTSASDPQILTIVFNRGFTPIYNNFNLKKSLTTSTTPLGRGTLAARARNSVVLALQLLNPSIKQSDITKFQSAINSALYGQHRSTDDAFGRNSPLGNAQPFSVRPILADGYTVGALVVTTRPDAIPSFVSTVAVAVFIASLVVAILAALAAILFSQTITRPLARIAVATRTLAAGDYSAQVITRAPGELGELAHNFNDMAAQLKKDVEVLQQQEIWRRELIMNITHDLATPLTAIAGLGESLMDGVNQSREDYEATGHIIMHETLRLRRLVQDLHVMAKVEAGALQPKLKPLRLASLVDEVLAVQAPEFERHQVEPVNAIPYDLPIIQADSDMLMRVFSNLCNNSLRHTPPEGTVTVSVVVEVTQLVVSFTDTGEGIPEEALQRIFERFYRADNARQSSTGGSGLGLAIVRAIIEVHGGTIWAENIPDAGARISFSLPLSTDKQPTTAETPTLPLALKSIQRAHLQK